MKLSQYPYIQAKNYTKGRNKNKPTIIVLHYTAGKGEAISVANFFKRGNVQASAHFAVSRKPDKDNNMIIQLVDTDDKSWHAGLSKFRNISAVNLMSIGIEICNAGWAVSGLDKSRIAEGKHRNPTCKNKEWEKYTEEQVKAVENLCKELKDIHPTLKYVTCHEDIRQTYVVPSLKGSKTDTGPLFPWNEISWDSMGLEEWHFNFKLIEWEKGNPK